MSTNREIIDRVKRIYYEKNMSPSDKTLSNRHIFDKLISSRNRVIAQELNRSNFVADSCYQSLLFSLEDSNEGNDTSIYKTTVRKSVLMIPEILSYNDRLVIRSVGDVGGKSHFYSTTWSQKKNIIGNKYTNKKVYYYFYNNYLYILNTSLLEKVIVTAIFADPLVEQTNTPILDRRFVADARLLDSIVTLTIDELTNKNERKDRQLSNLSQEQQ